MHHMLSISSCIEQYWTGIKCMYSYLLSIVWFQKISIPPPLPHGRDRIFQRGGGINLPNFPVGRGGHHKEIFPEGSRDAQRVTKKKHKKLPRQFIYEDIKHTTKVKELLNLRINGHNEDILSVPWRDLSRENVPYGFVVFERIWYPFERLGGYPFKKNCRPFERLGLSVWKRLSSVWTTRAIRLKKVVIRSNGLGYPFEKSCHPFERLGISVWKNCYPFKRLGLSVRKRICRPFERLKLSVQR